MRKRKRATREERPNLIFQTHSLSFYPRPLLSTPSPAHIPAMPPTQQSSRVWAWTCVLCLCVISVTHASLTSDGSATNNKDTGVVTDDSRSSNSSSGDGNSGVNDDYGTESDGAGLGDGSNAGVRDSGSSGDHGNYHEDASWRRGGGGRGKVTPPGGFFPSSSPPRRRVEVTRDAENNNTEVMIRCPSNPSLLFPNMPSSSPLYPQPPGYRHPAYVLPYDDDDDAEMSDDDHPGGGAGEALFNEELLVKDAEKGRGVEVDLTQLVAAGVGGQLVVDVEGCGRVGIGLGVPGWAEGVTFAIKGTLSLRPHWWAGSVGLREMWVRVNNGMSQDEGNVGGLCRNLPSTLEVLDISHTPTEHLTLEESCAPKGLQRLEAAGCGLTNVSLCSPSLVYLHVSNNELGGGLDWEGCAGGLGGVQVLEAAHTQLVSASVTAFPALRTLDLHGNLLRGALDLSTAANLTILLAAHNYLATLLVIPPRLDRLDLSHNQMTQVPVITPLLVMADLSHNQIEVIGRAKFKAAKKLELLSLASNHLTQLHERDLIGLRHLRTLDLSHNRLRTISTSAFHPLRHLRHLHLHHNHLRKLDTHTLTKLPFKAHATLHHNPWECSCHLLNALAKLAACKDCGHKMVGLECHEGGSHMSAREVLRTCYQAAQEVTQYLEDESDEDLSEEVEDDMVDGGESDTGAVMVVPGLVVVLVVGVFAALSYRVYHRHRRAITTRLAPFCGFCGYCAPAAINNNHEGVRRDQLSQIENDSDTETEM